MTPETHYIDGIGRVTVVNGLAHIEIVTIIPAAQDGGQAQPVLSHRFVMGLPQFVRMCAEMAGHLGRMEQKGLITRQAQPPAAS